MKLDECYRIIMNLIRNLIEIAEAEGDHELADKLLKVYQETQKAFNG